MESACCPWHFFSSWSNRTHAPYGFMHNTTQAWDFTRMRQNIKIDIRKVPAQWRGSKSSIIICIWRGCFFKIRNPSFGKKWHLLWSWFLSKGTNVQKKTCLKCIYIWAKFMLVLEVATKYKVGFQALETTETLNFLLAPYWMNGEP